MIELDPQLDPAEANDIAQDMSTRRHWRHMEPETAAQILFMPVSSISSSASA